MSYEEMQRMMQFILEQQAQLTANQQRAEERNARADKRLDRADKLINRIVRTIDRLATITVERTSSLSEELDAKFAALVDAQIRTEESMKRSDETFNAKINALAESQMRTGEAVKRLSERGEQTDESVRKTNESVRNLSDVVDRHLREHRNGERDVSRE
jgi:hypothetical protein